MASALGIAARRRRQHLAQPRRRRTIPAGGPGAGVGSTGTGVMLTPTW